MMKLLTRKNIQPIYAWNHWNWSCRGKKKRKRGCHVQIPKFYLHHPPVSRLEAGSICTTYHWRHHNRLCQSPGGRFLHHPVAGMQSMSFSRPNIWLLVWKLTIEDSPRYYISRKPNTRMISCQLWERSELLSVRLVRPRDLTPRHLLVSHRTWHRFNRGTCQHAMPHAVPWSGF